MKETCRLQIPVELEGRILGIVEPLLGFRGQAAFFFDEGRIRKSARSNSSSSRGFCRHRQKNRRGSLRGHHEPSRHRPIAT